MSHQFFNNKKRIADPHIFGLPHVFGLSYFPMLLRHSRKFVDKQSLYFSLAFETEHQDAKRKGISSQIFQKI